jgi:hypothetical protein
MNTPLALSGETAATRHSSESWPKPVRLIIFAMTAAGFPHRSGRLASDSTSDVETLQIDSWRRMSSLQKAELVERATADVVTLARAGIRQRHPDASERECFIRLAAIQLGPSLVRDVYPDARTILGPLE